MADLNKVTIPSLPMMTEMKEKLTHDISDEQNNQSTFSYNIQKNNSKKNEHGTQSAGKCQGNVSAPVQCMHPNIIYPKHISNRKENLDPDELNILIYQTFLGMKEQV